MKFTIETLLEHDGVAHVTAMRDDELSIHVAQYFTDQSVLLWAKAHNDTDLSIVSRFGKTGTYAYKIHP